MRHRRAPSLVAPLLALAGALASSALASCSDDPPASEPPIPLPPRDASPLDAEGCGDDDDPNNCGTCGNVCPDGPRGAAACLAGRCVLACDPGWGDCNGTAADGCETDLSSTIEACGACGRDCRTCGGTTCTDGLCDAQTFSTRAADVELIALAPDHVVYSDASGVFQIDKNDGTTVQTVYSVPSTPGLLVAGNVYFIYPGTEGFSGIYSTYAGFVGPQLASFGQGENVEAMALDASGIYYAAQKQSGVSRVVRCKDCSVATELAPNENRLRQGGIALDATSVFFGAGDMIRRVEKTGTGLTTLALGQTPRSLGVDDEWVYWINEAALFPSEGDPPSGGVARVKKTGGEPEVLASALERPASLIVAGAHLYVTDPGREPGSGVLFRIDKDGRSRVDLARSVTSLGGVAVDEACVWFAAGPDIRRVTR